MKCTSKSERRRQRNKNLLMGMGVVIVVLLIVLAVVLIKKKDASMPVSFDLTTEVFGQTVEEEALTADGLAADIRHSMVWKRREMRELLYLISRIKHCCFLNLYMKNPIRQVSQKL